jgi:O-acetylhomoserine (thiol)-lyase
VPIYQTTSYQFRDTEHAANLFALKDFGNIYSRIANPTCDALEQKMAALKAAWRPGRQLRPGRLGDGAPEPVPARRQRGQFTDLYGGTWNLFANTLSSMGITVRFADPTDPEAFRRATDDRTRAYYAETCPIQSSPRSRSARWRRGGSSACR